MYFSYDRTSDANLYPLPASRVREILKMNQAGEKPESLQGAPKRQASPEFVTAVGDDSISRFDTPKRRKPRGGKGRQAQSKGGAPRRRPQQKAQAKEK